MQEEQEIVSFAFMIEETRLVRKEISQIPDKLELIRNFNVLAFKSDRDKAKRKLLFAQAKIAEAYDLLVQIEVDWAGM